ncbi:MAG: hypothetical protein ACRDNW_12005, partial [Trebonia sp.]
GWKGAIARLTGQQLAITESTKAEEPALDTSRPFADAERRDDQDWLGELLRKHGAGQSTAGAETSAPGPSRGAADPLDMAKPPAEGGRETGARSAWGTDGKSAWGTGPLPVMRTGEQPVSRTGAQSAFTPTGPWPTFTPTGGQPTFTPTGPRPTFTSTGGQSAFTPAGPAPVSPPVTSPAGSGPLPAGSGPLPAGSGTVPVGPGPSPFDKPPWESDGWDKAADRDAGADPVPARDLAAASKPGEGNQPAAPSPAKPERHSHRGGKHGKPSRWRGSGGRPDEDRES